MLQCMFCGPFVGITADHIRTPEHKAMKDLHIWSLREKSNDTDRYQGLLAAIVLNAGGEIEVPTNILFAFPTNVRIEMHEYPETNVTCIRVID